MAFFSFFSPVYLRDIVGQPDSSPIFCASPCGTNVLKSMFPVYRDSLSDLGVWEAGQLSGYRASDSRSKGRGSESRQERPENFSYPASAFCADSYCGIRSAPVLPQ